jgi:hypothetical protein
MRGIDGSVIINLGDGKSTKINSPLTSLAISTLNENETTYNLYPSRLNEPPIITAGIYEASIPQVRSIQAAEPGTRLMYLNADQTIRIAVGKTITLRIQAQQPDTLNVENGVPEIIPSTEKLTYIWRKDNIAINATENRQNDQPGYIVIENALIIINPDTTYSGTYTCDVNNDIGTTSSEDVELEVIDVQNNPFFKLNHVTNPIGINNREGWIDSIGSIQVRGFSNSTSDDLKRVEKADEFAYIADMLNPNPLDLYDTYGDLLNYDPYWLVTNGSYFTRTKINYYINGEVLTVSAYQDIDLTEVQEYIQGSIYGVTGAKAVFSCYIGNAVSRFLHTAPFRTPKLRRPRRNYIFEEPRLSFANMQLAGLPEINETVEVLLEEYDKETQLPSIILDESTNRIQKVPRISFLDPWTVAKNNVSGGGRLQNLNAVINRVYDNNNDNKYTLGQFIQHNKVTINQLNYNTTKVRIRLNFSINDIRLVEEDPSYTEDTDEIYDIISWQKPYAYNPNTGQLVNDGEFIGYEQSQTPRNANKPVSNYIPKNGISRGLVTGINFNIMPILDNTVIRQSIQVTGRRSSLFSTFTTLPNPTI